MIDNILSKSTLASSSFDFKEGVMILVDKPMDWTSFDVVNKVRGKLRFHLQDRKIKVGHAGTLDPMATGLLIVCTGKYTKLIDSIQVQAKRYIANIQLGATTPSYDAESEIDARFDTTDLSQKEVEEACLSFLGKSEQLPPMFSAIKIKGQPLYKLARKGKTIERKSRPIEIFDLSILKNDIPELQIDVTSSKGTYIRTLAYDIGKKLNNGAYLSGLRRTEIGSYKVDDAIPILEISDWLDQYFS